MKFLNSALCLLRKRVYPENVAGWPRNAARLSRSAENTNFPHFHRIRQFSLQPPSLHPISPRAPRRNRQPFLSLLSASQRPNPLRDDSQVRRFLVPNLRLARPATRKQPGRRSESTSIDPAAQFAPGGRFHFEECNRRSNFASRSARNAHHRHSQSV